MQMTNECMKRYLTLLITAAKSLQSCPTLCNPIDSSPPGSAVPGVLQARTLEWVAISFSNAGKWKVKLLSRVRPSATPWTAAFEAPPSRYTFNTWPKNYILRYLPKRKKNMSQPKDLPLTICINLICYNPKQEIIHMSINFWISTKWYIHVASLVAQSVKSPPAMWETWVWSLGREDPLVHPYSGIPLRKKGWITATHNDLDEYQNHYPEWKKSDPKENIMYDFTCMKF